MIHMHTVFSVKLITTIVGIKEVMTSLHGMELNLSLNTNSSASGSINLGLPWATVLQNLQVKLKLKIPKPTWILHHICSHTRCLTTLPFTTTSHTYTNKKEFMLPWGPKQRENATHMLCTQCLSKKRPLKASHMTKVAQPCDGKSDWLLQ